MRETGRIREIKENIVIIEADKSAACFGCMNHECKSGGGFISAENPKALSLKPGQLVEVYAPGTSIAKQALAAFLPPVLGFILGYFIIRFLFPVAGEGAAAFTGAAFLFAAGFAVYRIRKKFPAQMEFSVAKVLD